MAARWQHTVTMENLNPCIKTMEYAVRGPLVIRATEIEKELESVSLYITFVQLCNLLYLAGTTRRKSLLLQRTMFFLVLYQFDAMCHALPL